MGLLVSSLNQKIAKLQKSEKIVGINARAGEEHNFSELAGLVQATLDMDERTFTSTTAPRVEVLRCGWIEKPAPDTTEGVHAPPLGKLWVVYKHRGGTVKRHEFVDPGDKEAGIFVVFEGHEEDPFCKRIGDGIRFVYIDMTFADALNLAKKGELAHIIVVCDAEEFERYNKEATRN